MYYIREGSKVYHSVDEPEDGRTACGYDLSKTQLIMYKSGRHESGIIQSRPPNLIFCKHCEKREGESGADC